MRLRRILVVDDSPIFLEAVASLLPAAEGMEVVDTASSGREALERVPELEPDLVLMDLAMPDINGLEAARRLAVLPRRPRIIIMTTHRESAYRRAALSAGADGFLHKPDLEAQLLPLIRTLLPECGEDADSVGDPSRGKVSMCLTGKASSATNISRSSTENLPTHRGRNRATPGEPTHP